MSKKDDLKEQVTIGIPVYNEISFIEETIESALIQGVKVFVSDNASTDGTSRICQEYAEKGLIDYVRQVQNIGGWSNFLYLASAVGTPYFMWLGGHDVLPPGYVNKLSSLLDQNQDVSLSAPGNVAYLNASGDILREESMLDALAFFQTVVSFSRVKAAVQVKHQGVFIHGLFRVSLLKKALRVLGQTTTVCPDMILLLAVAALGKFEIASDCVYKRREFREPESFGQTISRQIDMLDLKGIDYPVLWSRFKTLMQEGVKLLRGPFPVIFCQRLYLNLLMLRHWHFLKKTIFSLDTANDIKKQGLK